MRMLALLSSAMLLAGCGQSTPAPADCAARPADFRSFSDPFWFGPGVPIEAPTLLRIEVGRDGRLRWNGSRLAEAGGADDWTVLSRYLRQAGQLEPQPFVTLVFARETSCAAVERARRLIRHSLACGAGGRCFQGLPLTS